VHSGNRGKTVLEALNPETLEQLVQFAEGWCEDASNVILDSIWTGYDRMVGDSKLVAKLHDATDDLERGITSLLELAIHESLSGDEPFDVQHGVPEGESRKPPPARPREYDIAFVMNGNGRIMWPLEAKVMPPDRPLKEYVDTVEHRYLTCEYAPFVNAGAMGGYVLRAEGGDTLAAIEASLKCSFHVPPRWASRHHRISEHTRDVPPGKPYPKTFHCHHLMMVFAKPKQTDPI
jgi:hypothetical protein